MNSIMFKSKLYVLLSSLVYNLPLLLCSSSNATLLYKRCGSTFTCGSELSGIGYPFWGGARPMECGYPGLELNCTNNNITIIKIMGHKYQVLGLNKSDQTLNIVRDDLATNGGICLKKFVNTTLDFSLFNYTSSSQNLTLLYGCPSIGDGYGYENVDPAPFTCSVNGSDNSDGVVLIGSVGPNVKGCYKSVVVQVMESLATEFQTGNLGVEGLIAKGFEVKYNVETQACDECTSTNGRCGYDQSVNTTTCICANGSLGIESCGYNDVTIASSGDEKGMFLISWSSLSFGVIMLFSFSCWK